MSYRVIIGLLIISALSAPDITHARDNEKREDIRRLLMITDSGKMSVEVIKDLISSYRHEAPEVSDKFWRAVEETLDKDTFIDTIIPIYDKYLTHDEIKALIEFYSSPLGKKILVVQPKIVKESMNAGEDWGTEIGKELKKMIDRAEPGTN